MGQVQTSVSGFTEYHKIDTLFERDTETFVVNPAVLRKPVIGTIRKWQVTEKIDGTNIRVMLSKEGNVTFGGRSNNAQVPGDLLLKLFELFPRDKVQDVFWKDGIPVEAILFGEGYGAGIQKGGAYRPDKGFILFDVLVDGRWWLDWNDVVDVSERLKIPLVPMLGVWTLDQIVEHVRIPFASMIGTGVAEGIVARPIETLFDKRMERLIVKLKTKDFLGSKR
jgi:hypothetical protein